MSNFFTQLQGRKRVLIFPPGQAFNVYPHACSHPMDTYAMADVEALGDAECDQLKRLPALRRARALETLLEPGDVLWLPSFYWHYVRQEEEGLRNLSVNCWVGAKPDGSTLLGGRKHEMAAACDARPALSSEQLVQRLLACSSTSARAQAPTDRSEARDDATLDAGGSHGLACLLAARWLETEVAAALDESEVGPFLNALAGGGDAEERAGHDTGTAIGPAGSPTYTLAAKVRLELLSSVGLKSTCALLRAMTRHGRLHPGIAPPVTGPVVNSEKAQSTPSEELHRLMTSDGVLDGREDSPYL